MQIEILLKQGTGLREVVRRWGWQAWSRLVDGGLVPLADWLTGQGLPMGLAVAAAVTAVEIVGTPVFALGRYVPILGSVYSAICSIGVVMGHAAAGWFGAGKRRNGVEFSVLLIVCRLWGGVQHLRMRRGAPR